jgi:hypothetical protein
MQSEKQEDQKMNLIFKGYDLQVVVFFLFFLILFIFVRNYTRLSSGKRQPSSWKKSENEKILFLGLAALLTGVFGFLTELYLLGNTVMFLGTNPLLLICLRIDSPERANLLTNTVSGLIEGSGLMMSSLLAVFFAASFWFILDIKIKKLNGINVSQ